MLADDAAELDDLPVMGPARRDRIAGAIVMRGRDRRREAERALLERLTEQVLHPLQLFRRRLLADRALAHDDAADRGVTGEEAGVQTDLALEAVEIFAEAPPAPRHRLLQRLGRHRRDREAAEAAEHGGHAMEAGRAERRIPEDLGIIMGMDVDEARGDD